MLTILGNQNNLGEIGRADWVEICLLVKAGFLL